MFLSPHWIERLKKKDYPSDNFNHYLYIDYLRFNRPDFTFVTIYLKNHCLFIKVGKG